MKRVLLVALLALGCQSRPPAYDPAASAAYRAAWEKKLAGDEAGYRAALGDICKKYPNTRAGERAREMLAKK